MKGLLGLIFPIARVNALEWKTRKDTPPKATESRQVVQALSLTGEVYLLTNTSEPTLLRKTPDGKIAGTSFKPLPPNFWELFTGERYYQSYELDEVHALRLYEKYVLEVGK